jgi:hypothetical protein
VGKAARAIRLRRLHPGAVLKEDMKAKNRDKDRWLNSVRMPYDGTFARFEKRARYLGTAKCQFQAFMQALSHNMKRLLVIPAFGLQAPLRLNGVKSPNGPHGGPQSPETGPGRAPMAGQMEVFTRCTSRCALIGSVAAKENGLFDSPLQRVGRVLAP